MGRNHHSLGLQHWVPEGRRLVAVDIENLVGGSTATAAAIEAGVDEVRSLVGVDADDVWVWACGPTTFATAMKVLRTRVLVKGGVDGADQMLLDELEPQAVLGRFASVVLASGDGRAFVEPVTHLAAMGVPTDLIGRARATSHALRRVARSFTPVSRVYPVSSFTFAVAA